MKTGRRIFAAVLLVLSFLGLGVAYAQAPSDAGHRGMGGPNLQRMKERLGLTDAQVVQLKPILQSAREKRKARREAFLAKLNSILTPEQQAKFATMREQAQADRKAGKKPEHRKRFKELGLSPEQVQQLKAWREQNKPQVQAERQAFVAQVKTVLTPEQQQKLEQMMKARRGGHHGQGGPHKSPEGPTTP